MPDPFAAKRAAMRDEFFAKLFLLGGWLGGTDTYKRTMWAAVPDIALKHAAYTLTLRRGPARTGREQPARHGRARGHARVSGSTARCTRSDIELSQQWYASHSEHESVSCRSVGRGTRRRRATTSALPVDVWGFPGGQTFLAGVPCLTFEGPGGLVSYTEPAMCRYFAPVIQATKARLMREATPRDAEFGLRSAPVEVCNLILLLARFVGGAGEEGHAQLTSNDTAEFLYPDLFKSIGTIGHEMMCAAQSFDTHARRGRVRDDGPVRLEDGHRVACCATSWTPKPSGWRTPCASSARTRRRTASASGWIAATSRRSACCTSTRCGNSASRRG